MDPVSTLLVAGTVLKAGGEIAAGESRASQARASANARDFEALQFEQRAVEDQAAAQRAAMEEQRKSRLLQSRALAVAAASGGGAASPTVVDIISDLAGEGAYRASVAVYEGESRARQARLQAAASRYEGASLRDAAGAYSRAGWINAIGTSFMGGAQYSMYGKYGSLSAGRYDTETGAYNLRDGSQIF